MSLAAASLVMVFAFAAFVVDVGYITLSRAELSTASDAAAMAAAQELTEGYKNGLTTAQIVTNAQNAAVAVAAANSGTGQASLYCNPTRDLQLGKYAWNAATGSYTTTWGATPYNVAQVTLHRDVANSTLADKPLDLFFAPVIGHDQAGVNRNGKCAMLPIVGVKKIPNVNLNILPITLDLPTWTNCENGNGSDVYKYNSNGTITSGADGIKEVDLYPLSSSTTTAGNRGTVDIGSSNNSTADISRQIRYGVNDQDMSYFGGKFDWSSGSIVLNGDTGLSAGIKDDLAAIKGFPRLIPIFTSVSGPGNNANYVIVKFVGIRILHVQLTGNQKKVIVQPCSYSEPAGVIGTTTIGTGTVYGPVKLVK
jgi:Flp pilus assembly protein TadG